MEKPFEIYGLSLEELRDKQEETEEYLLKNKLKKIETYNPNPRKWSIGYISDFKIPYLIID